MSVLRDENRPFFVTGCHAAFDEQLHEFSGLFMRTSLHALTPPAPNFRFFYKKKLSEKNKTRFGESCNAATVNTTQISNSQVIITHMYKFVVHFSHCIYDISIHVICDR